MAFDILLRVSSTISLNWIFPYYLRSVISKPGVFWSSRKMHGQRLAMVAFLDNQRLSIESLYSLRDFPVQCFILGGLRLSHTSIFDWEGSVIGTYNSVGILIPKTNVFFPQQCSRGSCHHWYLFVCPPRRGGVISECSLRRGEHIHCFLDFGLSLLSCRGVPGGCSTAVYPLSTYLPELREKQIRGVFSHNTNYQIGRERCSQVFVMHCWLLLP